MKIFCISFMLSLCPTDDVSVIGKDSRILFLIPQINLLSVLGHYLMLTTEKPLH